MPGNEENTASPAERVSVFVEIKTLPPDVTQHIQPLIDLSHDYVAAPHPLEAAKRATALLAVGVLWCSMTGASPDAILGAVARVLGNSKPVDKEKIS